MENKTRPTFTPAYICDRLGLGIPWREQVRAYIALVQKDTHGRVDAAISDRLLSGPGSSSSDILLTLVAGIQIGMEIAEENAISPMPNRDDWGRTRQ